MTQRRKVRELRFSTVGVSATRIVSESCRRASGRKSKMSLALLVLPSPLMADVLDHWRITLEGRIKCFGLGASLFTIHHRLDQRRDEIRWNRLRDWFLGRSAFGGSFLRSSGDGLRAS